MPKSPRNPVSLRQWLFFAALVFMVFWGMHNFSDYGSLFSKLQGKPMLERGSIGSNEWQSFLARAGRPQLQEIYYKSRPLEMLSPPQSNVAMGWRWVVENGEHLPPDAKVYLNVPGLLLYFYGASLWHPSALDVTTETVVIKDGSTFEKNAKPVPSNEFSRLLESGYTHVVTSTRWGVRLLNLREIAGGTAP